jgi:signal transduction histidine kinase
MELVPVKEAPGRRMTESTSDPTPDELCAILARELRSPLSTIEGYLHLLVNGGLGSLTDEQREYLDVVSRNVDRLTSVVSDWLDLARLEAGKFDVARQPVDLEEIADRAIAELRSRIRSKEQQVSVETPAVPVMAIGDARALLQVVTNLLSNAHKYTPPGGAISLVLAIDDDTVSLDVVDTGIGVREDDQAGLFRKFFRANLTDAEPGTGLGLALTKALIEQMGGQVSMCSELGKGSTFTISIPRATEPIAVPDLAKRSNGGEQIHEVVAGEAASR